MSILVFKKVISSQKHKPKRYNVYSNMKCKVSYGLTRLIFTHLIPSMKDAIH